MSLTALRGVLVRAAAPPRGGGAIAPSLDEDEHRATIPIGPVAGETSQGTDVPS